MKMNKQQANVLSGMLARSWNSDNKFNLVGSGQDPTYLEWLEQNDRVGAQKLRLFLAAGHELGDYLTSRMGK